MYKNFLPECIYMQTLKYQKRVPDSLKLELKMVLNCHVGAGSQNRVLCKNSKYYKPVIYLTNHHFFLSFFF